MPKKVSARTNKKDIQQTRGLDESIQPNVTVKRNVKQINMRDHIKKRSMWAGSKTSQKQDTYLIQTEYDEHAERSYERFELAEVKYPPALYKIIDEIVVNAIDHYVTYPDLVSEIKITYNSNHSISVYNDGPGIYIERTQNINGVPMYTPQLIFSEFLAGSNLDDGDENFERIVGGQNGLGAKITCVFSDYFTVETCDAESKLHYTQTFRNGLQLIEEPQIREMTRKDKPYTKITFLPTYSDFKYNIVKEYKKLSELIKARAYQAAACTSIKVYFNDVLVPIKTFVDYCKLFNDNVYSTIMTTPDNKYPWEICIGLTDGKEQQISIVNGVFINSGGNHIKKIQKHIIENLQPRIEKELKKSKIKFNKNLVLNNLCIFMKGAIPNVEFLSQTKDAVSNSIEKFDSYSISEKEWNSIWLFVKEAVLSSFLKKQLGSERLRANRGKIDVPKYTEANFCRNAKKCHECGLIIAEGDSAIGTAKAGLLSKASPNFNFDYFGTFSIQGVPVNGLKESVKLVDIGAKSKSRKSITDEVKKLKTATSKSATKAKLNQVDESTILDELDQIGKRIPSKKVIENERLESLMKVLGLDYNKTYDFTDKGEKEWKTLRYGYIAGLTDQDLDGFNIFGLIITYFVTYWPNLIKRGFIRRIYTPLIRAYPKNKKNVVKEFYTESQAREWAQTAGEEYVKSNYKKFEYYKGLGSHKPAFGEVKQMFKNIDGKLSKYVLDNDSVKNMFIYYGPDTTPRKEALKTDVKEELKASLIIPLSKQFTIDSKMYQRDNIIRKLINAIDGFVDCRRKVFYTMRQIGRKRIKVQGAAGSVVSLANYHHGETSLEQSIIRMAHAFPEGRNLPLLHPLGNFGSRSKGYKDYASPRYIYTALNYRLADKLFRKEDDFILQYTLNDGARYEPNHYVPVIPYSLCESDEIPATGWTICTHARDISHIIKNVKQRIKGEIKRCKRLPIYAAHLNGRFQKYKNKLWFVGAYEIDVDNYSIIISGLPPNKWSYYYIEGSDADTISKKKEPKKDGIKHKEYVDDYIDETKTDQVKITLYLKPGAMEEIEEKYGSYEFDAYEDYFELKAPLHDRINLVNEKNEVIEYASYEDVFEDWFNYRKQLYEIRIEREIIIINLHIKMLREMQRFSVAHDSYNITKNTSEEESRKILARNKHLIFNKSLLLNPQYTELKLLAPMITEAKYGASYDYLLDMSYRVLTKDAYAKREEEIKKLQERLGYLEEKDDLFPGAKIWLKEVEECEDAINKGIVSGWFYGDNEYNFEDTNLDDTVAVVEKKRISRKRTKKLN